MVAISSTLTCEHIPKHVRLTIDAGMHEIAYLELCKICYFEQKPKFVISEEPLR